MLHRTSPFVPIGKPDPWSADIKSADDFLDPLFRTFSEKLGVSLVLRKNEYFRLAGFVPADSLDPEVTEKLDAIALVAAKARPAN